MKINKFKLERYFAKHEFTAKYLLSSSDCDGYALPYLLAQATQNELALWEGMTLGYTESAGNPLLREAIAQYYKIKSIENVVVATPGELNFISMNVLLDPTDHVVCVSPCYQSLSEIVNAIGCEHSFWKPRSDEWEFDPAGLEKLIQKNTKLIILNFPHNPTGSYLTQEQLDEVVRLARKHNSYIFSDEMYHKLIADNSPEIAPIADVYEKGISLWGTSKTFGLAGLRTGWLVAQDAEFLKKVIAFKDYLSICNSAPSEILSIIALNHLDAFLLPNLEKISRNIALFDAFVAENPILSSFTKPKAGPTSFVPLDIKTSSLEFSNQLVEKTGIMTLPCEMFNHRGKYIRVGFGRANFPEVLEILGRYLKTY